jgi:hypothetical protein
VPQAGARFERWLAQLETPLRNGVHTNSAFALGLALDYSRGVDTSDGLAAAIEAAALRLFGEDGAADEEDHPGHDFLSPSLVAADLMRRVLPPEQLLQWLERVFPTPRSWAPLGLEPQSPGGSHTVRLRAVVCGPAATLPADRLAVGAGVFRLALTSAAAGASAGSPWRCSSSQPCRSVTLGQSKSVI